MIGGSGGEGEGIFLSFLQTERYVCFSLLSNGLR